jgi:hypothetical protein
MSPQYLSLALPSEFRAVQARIFSTVALMVMLKQVSNVAKTFAKTFAKTSAEKGKLT